MGVCPRGPTLSTCLPPPPATPLQHCSRLLSGLLSLRSHPVPRLLLFWRPLPLSRQPLHPPLHRGLLPGGAIHLPPDCAGGAPAPGWCFLAAHTFWNESVEQFSSVQACSHVWLFTTPWAAARQASLSITNSQSYSNWCPLSRCCHPTISSSVIPFSSCFNLSQHQGLFKRVSFWQQVAKALEVQLQHQSLEWTFKNDFL